MHAAHSISRNNHRQLVQCIVYSATTLVQLLFVSNEYATNSPSESSLLQIPSHNLGLRPSLSHCLLTRQPLPWEGISHRDKSGLDISSTIKPSLWWSFLSLETQGQRLKMPVTNQIQQFMICDALDLFQNVSAIDLISSERADNSGASRLKGIVKSSRRQAARQYRDARPSLSVRQLPAILLP